MKKTWEDRLEKESDKLEDKIKKLNTFMNSSTFEDLHELDRDLLISQLAAMTAYAAILVIRLKKVGIRGSEDVAMEMKDTAFEAFKEILGKTEISKDAIEGPFSSMEELAEHLKNKVTKQKKQKKQNDRNKK